MFIHVASTLASHDVVFAAQKCDLLCSDLSALVIRPGQDFGCQLRDLYYSTFYCLPHAFVL